ncbi:MAG: hypothetical protein VX945_05730 [Verrucomicrobiota bacterium]|nr:hypothetical protein [Verrucomicrobiota bacterium]
MFLFLFLLLVGTLKAADSSAGEQLLDLGWGAIKGFGSIISKALLHMVLWWVFGFVVGVVGGVFMWRFLRDRGWMDVPWNWYKYVRWMWPVLIVGTLSLGLGSTLSTWGAGRAFKKQAREGEVIEKAVFNTYAMVMIWRLGPEKIVDSNGSALMEQDLVLAVSKLKKASDKIAGVEDKVREKALEEMEEKVGGGFIQKMIYHWFFDYIWDRQIKSELTNNEAVEFLSDTLETEKSGGAEIAVKAVRKKIMAGVYMAVDEMVNSITYPIIWAIIPSMVLILVGPLSSFWLVRWLWLRKYPETIRETESEQIQDDEPPVIEPDKS